VQGKRRWRKQLPIVCRETQRMMPHALMVGNLDDPEMVDRILGGHVGECQECFGTYIGRLAEERFFRAWQELEACREYSWFRHVRRPSQREDQFFKIDAVMETTHHGTVEIQIKTGRKQVRQFRKKNPGKSHIITVVIPPTIRSPRSIRRETVKMIELAAR
jgi:hypothetical protein